MEARRPTSAPRPKALEARDITREALDNCSMVYHDTCRRHQALERSWNRTEECLLAEIAKLRKENTHLRKQLATRNHRR